MDRVHHDSRHCNVLDQAKQKSGRLPYERGALPSRSGIELDNESLGQG